MGEADEDNLAAAGAQLRGRRDCILETLFDGLSHLFTENFPRHVARRRWRREERQPDLLNTRLKLAGLGASLDHARPTFAIHGLEIGRESRRNQRAGAIRNRQLLEENVE